MICVGVLVDVHAVGAATKLGGVTRAGHVADAVTVGIVVRVVAAPALLLRSVVSRSGSEGAVTERVRS